MGRCPVRCTLHVDGREIYVRLREGAKQGGQAGRYEYDEARLLRLCRFEEESILLHSQSPFTFIETVIAMYKGLLLHLFPDTGGQWAFTRIDLKKKSDLRDGLVVKQLHNLDFRLLKSAICHGSNELGNLYFTLVRP